MHARPDRSQELSVPSSYFCSDGAGSIAMQIDKIQVFGPGNGKRIFEESGLSEEAPRFVHVAGDNRRASIR